MIYQFKRGNTLSETLITMMVLGVVFTLSAGTMVADYNRNQAIVRLQKEFSTFSQAFISAKAKEGNSDSWSIGDNISPENSYNFFETYLKPNLNVMKDCKNSTEGDCNFEFKELNGTPKELNYTWARFYLADGAFVGVQTVSNDGYKVAYLYVDTNGKRRLNVVARDIFVMEYWLQNVSHPEYEGKLMMFGAGIPREDLISTSNDNNCNSHKSGNYCGALMEMDNWQIKDGYPWAQARYNVQ